MNIAEAINYLKSQDLVNTPVGRYDVDDDFYYLVQEYETKDPAACRMEAHRVYADIQWYISGEEAIDTISVAGLETDEDYISERDVIFFKDPDEGLVCHSVYTAGGYSVLPPNIAHKPGIRVGDKPCRVKKVVAKVRV